MLLESVWALGLSFVLALGAYLKGSLAANGALAAWVVGSVIWLGLGARGFAVLCVFFLTSTLLGRVGKAAKAPLQENYSKGDRRDAWQVFANGGAATVCAGALLLLRAMELQGEHQSLCFGLTLAAYASLASANADTWATELGVLSRSDPVHLLTLKRVPRGTSGAVSLLGLGVAALGSSCIAASAFALLGDVPFFEVALAGWCGALVDSLLGAVFQRQQRCSQCGQVVEATLHCGQRTSRWGSRLALLDNDQVNLLANTFAALLAVALWW